MPLRDRLLAALVASIWGFNFVVIDWGMGDRVPPLLFVAIRFTAVLLPAIFFIPRPTTRWYVVVGIGATMSLGQFGLLYSAMHVGMPAGLASLVLQAQVPLTIILATLILRERPTAAQTIGVSLGLVGLVMVAIDRGGHVGTAGLTLCLLAGLSWACGNVISRAARPAGGGLSLTVWSALVVPIPLFGLSLALDGPAAVSQGFADLGWQGAVSTAYTAGLSSLVGYGVWNTLLSRNPSAAVVPWTLMAPVVGIASAWLCFGEQPTLIEVLGGLFLLGGVLITQRQPVRPS